MSSTTLTSFMTKFSNDDGSLTFTADDLQTYVTENPPVVEAKPKKVKQAKVKAKRNPDMPVKPKTARGLFFEGARGDVKEMLVDGLNPDEGETLRGKDVLKGLAAAWKDLDEDKVAEFKLEAAAIKENWASDMETWYTENPEDRPEKKTSSPRASSSSSTKFDETQDPETPEGWTKGEGYIALTPIDPETGKGKTINFKSFDEAVAKAEELGDSCGGITRTSRGFSLRRGTTIAGVDFSKKEISWMKSEQQ